MDFSCSLNSMQEQAEELARELQQQA